MIQHSRAKILKDVEKPFEAKVLNSFFCDNSIVNNPLSNITPNANRQADPETFDNFIEKRK
jgi:hypothetical protein